MSDVRRTVRDIAERAVASGDEAAVQVAVYLHGEPIVDVAVGVEPSALIPSFSTGKAAASTIVHILAERGELDYDTPIAQVWPEFAAHGKGTATLRHALLHQVGVPSLPGDVTPEAMCDWDRMCRFLAGSEPWWEPGTATGYHVWTFGWIVGETVRRAVGGTMDELLRSLIGEPLGVAEEIYFGVPEASLSRVAPLENGGLDTLLARFPADGPFVRAALIGDVDGVRLLPEKRMREVAAVATADVDRIMGFPLPKALGYSVGFPDFTPGRTAFGVGGCGGSVGFADPDHGLAVAVTKTKLAGTAEELDRLVLGAVYRELGI